MRRGDGAGGPHPHPNPPLEGEGTQYQPPLEGEGTHQRGFIYAALILALAVMAAGSAVFATYWSETVKREREQELMRLGATFVQAIGAYYEGSTGTVKAYPPTLEALLEDRRYLQVRRHLRKIPRDPISLTDDWGLIPAPDGGVMGVYSRSSQVPLRQGEFPPWVQVRGAPGRYVDLRFVYVPG